MVNKLNLCGTHCRLQEFSVYIHTIKHGYKTDVFTVVLFDSVTSLHANMVHTDQILLKLLKKKKKKKKATRPTLFENFLLLQYNNFFFFWPNWIRHQQLNVYNESAFFSSLKTIQKWVIVFI